MSRTPSQGAKADRMSAIWVAYLRLGGNLTQQRFESLAASSGGLPVHDRSILDQVLFEEGL